jgi:RsiW-degrading membrane proteinase PrsW (M82 family)
MNPFQITLAILAAAGIPVLFLLIIYILDLYASRTFRLVTLCFVWGTGGGIGLAYLINTYIAVPLIEELRLDYFLLYIVFAPIVEEAVKVLPLVYISRRPEFTYFVDGATYGFASGIGFSITENFLYMSRNPSVALPLALIRAFSTCLMHGASTALVGAAIGRLRLHPHLRRRLMMTAALIFAVLVHAFFNTSVVAAPIDESTEILTVVGIGLGGFGATILFIYLGLREEQRWLMESLDQRMVDLLNADLTPEEREWLDETLDRQAGVSIAEVRASQAYEILDEILGPVARKFPRKAEQIERIVLQQAQIGIKRRVQEEVHDTETKGRLGQEIARLEEDTRQLRKKAGVGAMAYLKCVFDENNADIGACLEELVACTDSLACRDEERTQSRDAGAQESGNASIASFTSG